MARITFYKTNSLPATRVYAGDILYVAGKSTHGRKDILAMSAGQLPVDQATNGSHKQHLPSLIMLSLLLLLHFKIRLCAYPSIAPQACSSQ